MRWTGWWVMALLATPLPAAEVPVLVWHDIATDRGDAYAVTAKLFREQMSFLKRAGYQPLRLADYLHAANHGKRLPEKPVLLTFDDGLQSFKDTVLPLLEEYRFPAVVSITTGWLDGRHVPEPYHGRLLDAGALRDVSRSPWVEIISHSDALHAGIPADPYGSLAPAAVARRYLGNGRYESEPAYRERVCVDLRRSRDRIAELAGKPPMAIAWPFGEYNMTLVEEAAALGMPVFFTLNDTLADTRDVPRIHRIVLRNVQNLAAFEQLLQPDRTLPARRLVEIQLDDLFTTDPIRLEQNLNRQIERVRLLRANTVIVSPFTRDGRAGYFAASGMPVRADLLHRVLHQLRTAAGVRQLILRLPAEISDRERYRELARRHPCDALLLDGAVSDADAAWLVQTFSYYRPGLACGTEQASDLNHCREFKVFRVSSDTDELPAAATATGHGLPPVYVLVDGDRPAETLRALRRRGVRNLGIVQGGHLNNSEALWAVAQQLAQPATGKTR